MPNLQYHVLTHFDITYHHTKFQTTKATVTMKKRQWAHVNEQMTLVQKKSWDQTDIEQSSFMASYTCIYIVYF